MTVIVLSSIKLESYQVPRFCTILEEFGVQRKSSQSDFEVFFGEYHGGFISISLNGQVKHDNNRRIQELIDLAYEEMEEGTIQLQNERDNQEYRYMVLARRSKPSTSAFQVNHLNIWLNSEQYKYAIELFLEEEDIIQIDNDKSFEQYRFLKDHQKISFHKNGKIIAEHGYSKFAPYLTKAIESYLPFQEFDLIIGQDEVGNGERIGPLVVGAVGATPKQLIDLQLVGIKDSKMVPRSISLPMGRWIRDIAELFWIKKLDPIDFNKLRLEQQCSIPDILFKIHRDTVNQLKKKIRLFKDHKIIYIIDQFDKYKKFEELQDLRSVDIEVRYLPHGEQQSTSVAAASLLAKSERLRWINAHEKVHNIQLTRKNLAVIRQHRKSSYLLKSI